ncbi:asparagine synthase (glutamine-hydrolyzing) [Pseudopedobacter saltans DSM 12145]|uniref:asparagine synthase (glutamine-hydrolyzing) n=1 Tax=Pseudopedobacter saltans (strain ATCC 51119 / DSM 12145 / JCM 21818 / CCUG 39354 / LMG 10337 / NBRC 100064 / NCIMB 13643) TaxID=762903 RepID=F0S9P5_PSESL|nr:asparagine synthase (glutamine-hydrolyzing) [Pseudopedobacter saltans]ADY51401.1 asparagine synthase (glutamine-hydrolyzing) [Pseudopedobacter saltans DSM 12145]
MCGIFGTLNFSASHRAPEIFCGLYHRGPNDRGLYKNDNVELFHTRLAIQDLSEQGKQPMRQDHVVIVFNGEIYNHLELRKKYNLQAESNSDTQTILMLYKKLGMQMLKEFDGMFAFALYDEQKKQLFLARDRAGKRPLYVYQKGDSLVFSSELNTLYKITKPCVNYESLSSYLYIGYHYKQDTPYKEVIDLQAGSYLQIDTVSCKSNSIRWFDISQHYFKSNNIKYPDAITELDAKLNLAVKRRIESSDLDVGCFLSGGIDSGLVTAIASGYKEKLKTFTVKLDGAYDESALAYEVANKYATEHTVVDITFDDLNQNIEKILINYGEPFCDSSAIPSYYVAKAAKQHITVVLNGDGADELFGGYRRYVPFRYFDFFNTSALSKYTFKSLLNILPIANEKKSRYNYFYRMLKFASYRKDIELYTSASYDLLVGFEKYFVTQPNLGEIENDLLRYKQYNLSSLSKILLIDFEAILFSDMLPKMDIATMSNSLEGRSPFLSKEILEFAPGLEDNFKINNLQTKKILRDLSQKYLPDNLINQPKRGFEVPLKRWMDTQLKEIVNDYLLSKGALYPSLVNKNFIHDLMNRKIKISDERRAKILYNIFALEVWHKNLKSNVVSHDTTFYKSQNLQLT